MVSPTSRRASARHASKVSQDLDSPPEHNLLDNSVQDRIRQWQAQGGGVVIKNTPATPLDEQGDPINARQPSRARRAATPDAPASETTQFNDKHGEANAAQHRRDRDSDTASRDLDPERSVSTPRRRVISDEHWRRKKSPPRSADTTRKGRSNHTRAAVTASLTPGPLQPNGAPGSRSKTKFYQVRPQPARPDNRRTSDHHAKGSIRSPSPASSADARRCSTPSVDTRREPTSSAGARRLSTSSAGAAYDESPGMARNKPRHSSHNQSETAKATGGLFSKRRESHRQAKALLGQVFEGPKRAFSKPERSQTLNSLEPETSTVEAWLQGTDPHDDPFLVIKPPDDEIFAPSVCSREPRDRLSGDASQIADDLPPAEVPAPLHYARRRRPRVSEDAPADLSHAREEAHRRHSERRARRKRASDQGMSREHHSAKIPQDMHKHSTLSRHVDGSHEATDTSTPPQPSSQARKISMPASLAGTEEPIAPSSAPSSLRRRGARRTTFGSPKRQRSASVLAREIFTPPADRAKRDSSPVPNVADSHERPGIPADATVRHRKSSSTEIETDYTARQRKDSSAEAHPQETSRRRQCPPCGQRPLSVIISEDTISLQTKESSHCKDATHDKAFPDQHGFKPTPQERDVLAELPNSSQPLGRTVSKGRLTRHADLISVLSMPAGGNRSLRSARSIRTNRSRLAAATIEEIMTELRGDEDKYMRELRTLVDGVIPVLLSSILSRSGSATAIGLFKAGDSNKSESALTRPIVDMGIALERLKLLHRRVPLDDATRFLTWAQGAQRVYQDYLKAWRLGFQDVVVNLAPASADGPSGAQVSSTENSTLPRNSQGDIVDKDGERVDVAFLLKRPLVRLKYLTKTLQGINYLQKSSQAEDLIAGFQTLVDEARNRANEERARLEDEAAASIDASRAKDPHTLESSPSAVIPTTRRVRARDCFNLSLHHSSGQQIDCRTELLLRDDEPGRGQAGDLLICEIDGSGRWLFFPPIELSQVSARNGDEERQIIVMIRGSSDDAESWHELLVLKADDEQTGFEWVQMLGLTPVPPALARQRSSSGSYHSAIGSVHDDLAFSQTHRKAQGSDAGAKHVKIDHTFTTLAPQEHNEDLAVEGRARLRKRQPSDAEATSPADKILKERQPRRLRKAPDAVTSAEPPPFETVTAPDSRAEEPPSSKRERYNERRLRRQQKTLWRSSPHSVEAASPDVAPSPTPNDPASGKLVPGEATISPSPGSRTTSHGQHSSSPLAIRTRSSAPSLKAPELPKMRQSSAPYVSDWTHGMQRDPRTKVDEDDMLRDRPPVPPPHRVASWTHDLSPPAKLDQGRLKRRSASPLKQEYAPSSSSASASDSETSTIGRNDETPLSSDDSGDEELEDRDIAMPLLPVGAIRRLTKRNAPQSLPSLPAKSLGPSSSASQAPYKAVPAQPHKAARAVASICAWSDAGCWDALHPDECSVVVTPGLIEAFELIPVHINNVDGSGPDPDKNDDALDQRPLIAQELTPLVLIRRGTALDISVRSPLTPSSRISAVSNNNILFRSRTAEECEALYNMINFARINNPTYIALQNARVTSCDLKYGGASFNRPATNRGGSLSSSWLSLGRRGSYRASSAPSPSLTKTETSVGSLASAFSALKRFGGGSSRFSIARSTVTSRFGSGTNSVYSPSDHSSGSGSTTPAPGLVGGLSMATGTDGKSSATPLGLSNAKIRLYIRESSSKWRDLGAARLTISKPTAPARVMSSGISIAPSESAEAGSQMAAMPPSADAEVVLTSARHAPDDKRILVIGKTQGETLLDATLGESCFERIARTGIAVSVWQDFEGGQVAKRGGVIGGTLKVYMIQMKSEPEAAYTFSLVGKLRY